MVSYSVKLKCNSDRIQTNGNAALFLSVIINREVKRIPLNLSWPAHLVDNKAGVMHPRQKRDPDFSDYQLIITNELQKINEIFKVYRIQDKVLTMDMFEEEVKNIDRRRDFLVYMEDKITSRFTSKQISRRTKLNSLGTLNRLKKFKGTVPFHATDRKLLQKFKTHLLHIHKNDDATVWTRLKDVKTYLHLALEDGISMNQDFEHFVNKPPMPSITYLEEDEIHRLTALFLSNSLDTVRQQTLRAFLFSCFTSLRVSDVYRAEWGWLQFNNELQFLPWKNRRFKREVNIPLSTIARNFIEKRTGKFFNLPAEQEMNRSLKDIACMQGINIKKRLTFHVARHTFGTHYYRQTKDVVALQKIMGHSKVTTTMVYVHVNEQDKRTGMDIMNDAFMKKVAFMRLVS